MVLSGLLIVEIKKHLQHELGSCDAAEVIVRRQVIQLRTIYLIFSSFAELGGQTDQLYETPD